MPPEAENRKQLPNKNRTYVQYNIAIIMKSAFEETICLFMQVEYISEIGQ